MKGFEIFLLTSFQSTTWSLHHYMQPTASLAGIHVLLCLLSPSSTVVSVGYPVKWIILHLLKTQPQQSIAFRINPNFSICDVTEWVAMPSSQGWNPSLRSPASADGFFTTSTTWEAYKAPHLTLNCSVSVILLMLSSPKCIKAQQGYLWPPMKGFLTPKVAEVLLSSFPRHPVHSCYHYSIILEVNLCLLFLQSRNPIFISSMHIKCS